MIKNENKPIPRDKITIGVFLGVTYSKKDGMHAGSTVTLMFLAFSHRVMHYFVEYGRSNLGHASSFKIPNFSHFFFLRAPLTVLCT